MMRRYKAEDGATLIMVVGIIAALAIMGASLVVLTTNAQHNTARDRQQTRSFAAAEAAVDDALATLGGQWPGSEALALTFDDAAEEAFKTRYVGDGSSGDYPNLQVSIWCFDDGEDINDDGVINEADSTWDQNENDRMYVEAQATVGQRTTRLRALVQRETIGFEIPRGTAFYTEGDLWTHGGSDAIGVDPLGQPPEDVPVKGEIGGTYSNDGGTDFSDGVNVYVGNPNLEGNADIGNVLYEQSVESVDKMFNPSILDYLSLVASPGNYYTDPDQVSSQYIPPTTENPDPDDLTGLVYIESAELANFQITEVLNSPEKPGILIVRGGSLTLTGGGEYYGIVFVDGGATDLGNVTIHGAVICAGGAQSELGGSQTILYDDRVWLKLSETITLAAKIVPNSWREIPPVAVAP
jgi:Tfp pilus assembly protein PilX